MISRSHAQWSYRKHNILTVEKIAESTTTSTANW